MPRMLLFVPGTLFWVLVIIGATTGNGAVIGAAVVLFLVTAATFATTKVRQGAAAREERDRVWRDGTRATATVVGLAAAGGSINNDPEVELVLEVARPGHVPYEVKLTGYISQLAIPRVQPGCEIAVRIDLADPSKVAIDPALGLGGLA